MIHINPNDKIYVASKPIDFRCGIDGIMSLVKDQFFLDPFSGGYFCFVNRLKSAMKILFYDGQGFWLMHKRFSQGSIPWWPNFDDEMGQIDAKNFLLLIFGGDGKFIKFKKNWKEE